MKQTLTALLIGIGLCAFADMPTITNVTARQRYPWNGKVDISYTLTGNITEYVNPILRVTATDRMSGNTYTASSLSGDTGLFAGDHALVWDMNADGLTYMSSDVIFEISVIISRYLVIDLSGGSSASSYPVTYLADPPSGGFNTDEYKKTKLVLRYLEPGPIPTRDATITRPFFVGLFEVTQKQYSLVMGNNPSEFSGDTRPVECVSYNAIRGSSLGAQWPASDAVDSDSFLGKLRTRTGLAFDLPTAAQGEYACRAGTTTAYSYGDSVDGNYMWYRDNSSSQTHEVGTKLPNVWGLYDMHGNVSEWCLDWWGSGGSSGNDPVGPSSSPHGWRVGRGGGWDFYGSNCTSSFLDGGSPGAVTSFNGFRLVRNLSD